MARPLTLDFENTSNPPLQQTWFLDGQGPYVVPPGHGLVLNTTVTGNANIPFSVEVNENTLYSALLYRYDSDTYTFFPDWTKYLTTIVINPNQGADFGCSYDGLELISMGYTVNSLQVRPKQKTPQKSDN